MTSGLEIASSNKLQSSFLYVGGEILNLITSGIHNNPLDIYREYIQNSVDSIALLNESVNGKIQITINLAESKVSILDNGLGMTHEQAIRDLLPISRSRKNRKTNNGFRGIGRLSALQFCQSVTFLTRSNKSSPVIKMVWNGVKLRNYIRKGCSVDKAIAESVSLSAVDKGNCPERFFEVQIEKVSRFAASSILNCDRVREYVSENCPIPFSKHFSYASQISNSYEKLPLQFAVDVYINDDSNPVRKPYKNTFDVTGKLSDSFSELETFEVPTLNKDRNIAYAWLAHSSYYGALPKNLRIRGIRARMGNTLIGNEKTFDHLFTESRFNRWCVGEVNVVGPQLVPNARRDYFEPGPHLRNLENYIRAICRQVETRCRLASKLRLNIKRCQKIYEDANSTYELANSGYLSENTSKLLIQKKLKEIFKIIQNENSNSNSYSEIGLLELVEKLQNFQSYSQDLPLNGFSQKEANIYQNIFDVFAEIYQSPQEVKQTIEEILKRLNRSIVN